jgi:hypothetical protein
MRYQKPIDYATEQGRYSMYPYRYKIAIQLGYNRARAFHLLNNSNQPAFCSCENCDNYMYYQTIKEMNN